MSETFREAWEKACLELQERDPVLGELIRRYRDQALRPSGDAFTTLANAIVGQQISIHAAAAVWQRLLEACGQGKLLHRGQVLRTSRETLRAVGLSERKITYLQALAWEFEEGALAAETWHQWSDRDLMAFLQRLRGVGRWTAHMFLIFHLGRLDVLPSEDLGLLKAFERHYGPFAGDRQALRQALESHAERHWAPYRTVATWYLWRDLDPVVVEY